MLKQTNHIILSIILLVSTIGLVVSKHYCNEELVSVSFYDISDSCCDDNSCCHEESETYQLKVDYSHNTTQIKVDNDHFSILLHLMSSVIADFLIADIEQSIEYLVVDYSPPLSHRLYSITQSYLL
jgi:hypothetical protein